MPLVSIDVIRPNESNAKRVSDVWGEPFGSSGRTVLVVTHGLAPEF